jgi:hypothetical protein
LPLRESTAPSSWRRSFTLSDSHGSSIASVVRNVVGFGDAGLLLSITTTPSCVRLAVWNEVS